MSKNVNIDYNNKGFKLSILGYEREQAGNVEDLNWLDCYISVSSKTLASEENAYWFKRFGDMPTFNFKASLMTYDIARFYDELKQLLRGQKHQALLNCDEDWVNLSIVLTDMGNYHGVVVLHPDFDEGPLTASFDLTLEQLKKISLESEALCHNFPVKNL